MVKYAQSLNEVINYIYVLAKICGVAPFNRFHDRLNNRYYFEARPIGWHHFFINGGVMCFLSVIICLRLKNLSTANQLPLAVVLNGAIFDLAQTFTIVMIITFVVKQRHFIKCLELIEEIDNLFKDRNLPVSYKFVQISGMVLLFILTPIFIFLCGFPIFDVINLYKTEGCRWFCRDYFIMLFNYPVQWVAQRMPLYFFTMVLYIAYERFKILNNYIEDVQRSNPSDYNTIYNLYMFFRQLHSLLYHLIKEINKVFTLQILLVITHTFMHIMTTIVSYFYNAKRFQVTTDLFLYVSQLFMQLIVCQMLQIQVERSRRVENQISLPYRNKEMADQRKFLLLQLYHEKITLSAYGFYDLNLVVIPSNIGMMMTMILFFTKLQQLQELKV